MFRTWGLAERNFEAMGKEALECRSRTSEGASERMDYGIDPPTLGGLETAEDDGKNPLASFFVPMPDDQGRRYSSDAELAGPRLAE